MKKLACICVISFLFFFIFKTNSQILTYPQLIKNTEISFVQKESLDTSAFLYNPLSIGNSWKYHFRYSNPYGGINYYYKETVIDTIKVNSHLYFVINNTENSSLEYLRLDSLNGNLLKYALSDPCPWLTNDYLVDSLASKQFDTSRGGCDYLYRCDTSRTIIYNIVKLQKSFSATTGLQMFERKYVMGVGLIYNFQIILGHSSSSWETSLVGCVINGIAYGDTTVTLLNQISDRVARGFNLSQNYPNPFNPSTKIGFEISKLSFVRLVVYDILGREVEIMVNEILKPNSYEYEWNAGQYASGIYFYTLETNDFRQTRKMVLMK